MPVQLPVPDWPSELFEAGPPEDPFILLSGSATVGSAPYRILAIRINPTSLAIDYRINLGDDIYDTLQLEDMLEGLTLLDDIDRSVLILNEQGHYVIWMMPWHDTGEA